MQDPTATAVKKKQDDIKAAAKRKLDKKFGAGTCGCDNKKESKIGPDGKAPTQHGPVGCGCKQCQKDAIDKAVKKEVDKKKEKADIKKAKMKAKEIKMHAAEKKHVDDKVNAAKEATERDVNQIEKRTEQAISNIQASALETIKAMKESMPNYDPSNENSAAVKKMHDEV